MDCVKQSVSKLLRLIWIFSQRQMDEFIACHAKPERVSAGTVLQSAGYLKDKHVSALVSARLIDQFKPVQGDPNSEEPAYGCCLLGELRNLVETSGAI